MKEVRVLALSVRKVDDVVIMDFSGKFSLGEPVDTFREALRLQLRNGARKFVWNLQKVESLDSAALGTLVSAQIEVQSKGGDVKLLLRKESESGSL